MVNVKGNRRLEMMNKQIRLPGDQQGEYQFISVSGIIFT